MISKEKLALLIVGPLAAVMAVAAILYPEASLGLLLGVLFWLFFWFVYYLSPGVLMSSPFWILGRRRAQWIWWEFAILIVPYLVWVAFLFINDRGKDLPNLVEMFWLGCALPLAALVRVAAGRHISRRIVASGLIAVYSLIAIILWATVAPIPLSKR
jgi:hypothetical protein